MKRGRSARAPRAGSSRPRSEAWAAEVRPATRVFLVEAITNPCLEVAGRAAAAELARARGPAGLEVRVADGRPVRARVEIRGPRFHHATLEIEIPGPLVRAVLTAPAR